MNTKNNNNLKNKFLKRAIKKYSNKFNYKKVNYINRDTPVIITCEVHGDFEQTPNSHLKSKHGCPICGNDSYKLTKEEFIEKSNKVHNDIYDYSKVNYINTTTKVEITCIKHGSFWQEPYLHYSKAIKCPKCSIEQSRLSKEEFITRSNKIHSYKYDYSKVHDFISNREKVSIICKKHGVFKQQVRSHITGNGCKQCFLESNKDTKEEFVKKAIEVHSGTYDYSKVKYIDSKTPVEIICKKHGVFKQRPNSHIGSKAGCPRCNDSKGEKRISVYLDSLNIKYQREFKINNFKYRYDFYLPEFNILIEYDGIQHFKPVEFLNGLKGYVDTTKNDKLKNELALINNIPLIRIPYTKYNDLENYLIYKLKKVYKYWFVIDNKIVAYKNFLEVCKFYNLPGATTSRTLIKELEKVVVFKSLF